MGRTMNDALERVRAVVAKYCDIDVKDVWPNSNFVEDLGLDSLDSIEMVMAVEEEFGVELTDNGLEVVKTVEQLANAIDQLIKKD